VEFKVWLRNGSFKKYYFFLFFNVINLGVIFGVLSQSLKANLYGLSTNMDYVTARTTLGGHDSGSYLEGSLQLLGLSQKDGLNDFVWQYWPPGMPVTLFFLSKFSFLFQHALLAGVLIQVISVLIIQNNLRIIIAERSRALSILFPIFFLSLFSPYRDWVLGYGLLYAEGPAIAFLTSSIVILYKRERILKGNLAPLTFRKFVLTEKWLLGSSGFLFGIAAYFRGPFDTMMQACFFAWIIFSLKNKLRGQTKKSFDGAWIFFGFYFIVTVPWRIISYSLFKIPFSRWTSLSGDAIWAYIPNDELIRNGQEAWAYGNLNWGCQIVTSDCGSTQRGVSDLVNVMITYPFDFLTLRIPQFVKTLGLPGSELYPWSGKYNYVQSTVWLIITFAVLFLIFQRLVLNTVNFFEFMIIFSITSTILLILVTHFESRYFLPATLLVILFSASYRRSNPTHN